MSLIKLATTPILVINNTNDPNSGTSKTFSMKNLGAAAVGGTTGFALSHGITKIPGFNPDNVMHAYGKRMGSVLGGFAGAAGLYHVLNKRKKEHQPNFYML